jgi:carbamoyl-phosphate synthase large subunit
VEPDHVSVKESVFPFDRFPDVDIILGPEMKSTGEVMGIDFTFEVALAKALLAAGLMPTEKGAILFSIADRDRLKPYP